MNDKPYKMNELESRLFPTISKPEKRTRVLEPVPNDPGCEKSWSIAEFESKRRELTDFVREKVVPLIERKVRRILIRAPVKSGKRDMVEYIAMRDLNSKAKRVHAFISAWHRQADSEQRVELKNHNLAVFSIISDKNVESFLKWREVHISLGYEIVIHLDECDYGSADNQKMSMIWPYIRSDPKISVILYSATPEEAMFSQEFDEILEEFDTHSCIVYTPPEGFCGPSKFLEEGLVHDAQPFFHTINGLHLSNQAKEIIGNLRTCKDPRRNIIILRLTHSLGGNKKENKAIHTFLDRLTEFEELTDFDIIVDKDKSQSSRVISEDIRWSSKSYWDEKGTDKPLLIVIDQTSTRSTEWFCHDRVFATHDYRPTITYVVVSQAQERVNHYSQKYGDFQPIHVYGHKRSFLLSAGQITHDEYLTHWHMRKVNKRDVFKIQDKYTGEKHPTFKEYYSIQKAQEILCSLDSYLDVNVSSRVAKENGSTYTPNIVFIPCNDSTKKDKMNELIKNVYEGVGLTPRSFDVPFHASEKEGKTEGKYKGYLRDWKVWNYDEVEKELGWGLKGRDRITICYKNGVLGIALRYKTAKLKQRLKAYDSMFSMKGTNI